MWSGAGGGGCGWGGCAMELGGFSSDMGAVARHPTPYTSDESGGLGGLVLRAAA